MRPNDLAMTELFERYVANECDPAERVYVENLFQRHPELRTALADIQMQMVPREARGHDWDTGAAFSEFWRIVRAEAEEASASQRLPQHGWRTSGRGLARKTARREETWGTRSRGMAKRLSGYGVAAALAVLAAGVYQRTQPKTPSSEIASRTYTTKTAQQATVELADGSRMLLAPNTQATVVITPGARTITLRGEAHFDVVPNLQRTFVVQTGNATTRVLGTTFDVRQYPGERTGEVVVHAGKVMTSGNVRRGGRSIVLTAGMTARFTDSLPALVTTDAATTTDWAHGRLVFRSVAVPEVLATLKRWYGYDFRLADSTLADQHVTASFLIGDSADMLRLVQRVLGVSMTFEDSVITLRSGSGGSKRAPARIQIRDAIPTHKEVGR